MSKTISHLTLVQPMAQPKMQPKRAPTPQELLENSEAELKGILQGRGKNARLKRMAEDAMKPDSQGKLLADLDHGDSDSEE